MAASSSRVLRCTPRRSCFSVSRANQRSTRLSQDALVGVKCRWKRGWRSQPAVDQRRLVGAVVVENQVDVQLGGHRRVDRVEELAELDGPMAAMALADDLARSWRRGRRTARWCRGARSRACAAPTCPGRIGSSGCVRSSAWIWRLLVHAQHQRLVRRIAGTARRCRAPSR